MLKGVICDATGEKFSFDECIACARNGGPRRCHNPLPLIVAMSRNAEERRDAGISATALLDCPRKVILMQEEDYHEAPSKYWARFRGTLVHAMFEAYGDGVEGVIQEVRLRKTVTLEVDGESVDLEITGKPDWVDIQRKLIIDFKTTKSINVKPIKNGTAKENHEEQVNIYRWLLWGGQSYQGRDENDVAIWGEPEYHEIRYGGICYADMSGTKKVSVDIWSIERAENYIRERLLPLATYKATGEMPPFWRNERGYRHVLCGYCPLKEACDARGEGP